MDPRDIKQLNDILDALLEKRARDIKLSDNLKVLEPGFLSMQEHMNDCIRIHDILNQIALGNYRVNVDGLDGISDSIRAITRQLSERAENNRAQQRLMKNVFDNIEPIFIIDSGNEQHILYANKTAGKRFGIHAGLQADILNTDLNRKIFALPRNGKPTQVADNITGRWYNVTCTCLPWDNCDNAVFFHCTDITVHKQREQDLQLAASTAELTGLYNRRGFEAYFIQCWELCLQQNRPLSLLMFDIDFFKKYNDTYGHLQGDKCIISFANILRNRISRSTDVITRFGGEEFLVLLPFTTGENAVVIADSVRLATQDTEILMQNPGKKPVKTGITVSCGASTIIPTEYDDPVTLTRSADSALYLAKETGRNRTCYRDSAK